jgi:hypothetical protein
MADATSVTEAAATTWQLAGAIGFGVVIGWQVYAINRQRKDEPTLNDLVTLIGVIGGTAVLALFPARTDLFGAFGIGLAGGFFLYFLVLIFMVGLSKGDFTVGWFLDGRRRRPRGDFYVPTRDEQAKQVLPAMESKSPPESGSHQG